MGQGPRETGSRRVSRREAPGSQCGLTNQSRGSVSRAEPGGDRMPLVREATSSLKDRYQRPEEEVILGALGSDTLMAILAE